MRIGYHISISKGLTKTAQAIKEQKMSAVQIFPGSPKSYFPGTKHTQEDFDAMKNLNIPKFVHINYFVNLCGDKEVIIKSVAENLSFCDKIGADGLVIHMGSHKDKVEGMKQTIKVISDSYFMYINELNGDSSVKILIETTAEGGNRLKWDAMLELKELVPEIFFVLDSAHLYAAGYSSEKIISMIEEHHDKIKLMHLNNPAPNVEFGKHKDQHDIPLFSEEGKFSVREMENIINICKLYDIPMVMETAEMEETLELINEKYK
jgi:endonuclease IV